SVTGTGQPWCKGRMRVPTSDGRAPGIGFAVQVQLERQIMPLLTQLDVADIPKSFPFSRNLRLIQVDGVTQVVLVHESKCVWRRLGNLEGRNPFFIVADKHVSVLIRSGEPAEL